MTLSAAPGTLVRVVHNATASLSLTSVPSNALIVLLCVADANNGNTGESLSIGTTAGLTWTRSVQANGGTGSVASIFTAPSGAGGTLSITVVDSDGMANASAELGVQPVTFTDSNGGTPGVGATGGDVASIVTTVDNSWVWFTNFSGGVTNGTQTIVWASTAGGFDGGDTVSASKINSTTPTHGTTVSPTLGGAHGALIEITPGTPSSAPAFVSPRPARRRTQAPRRRPTATTPVRAQVNPPFPSGLFDQPRQPRGRLVRRGRATAVVPPQVTFVNPPTVPTNGIQPRRLRGLLARRTHAVSPVPAQVTFQNPAYPFTGLRARVRGALSRRGHAVQVVPPQITPPASVWSPQPVRVRLRAALVRRGRVSTHPPTHGRVPLVTRVRLRLAPSKRGRTVNPPPAQIVVTPPAYPPQPVHRTRRGLRRRTHGAEGWMVGSSAPPINAGRMASGTTSVTASGTTAAEASGSTSGGPKSGTASAGGTSTTSAGGPVSDG